MLLKLLKLNPSFESQEQKLKHLKKKKVSTVQRRSEFKTNLNRRQDQQSFRNKIDVEHDNICLGEKEVKNKYSYLY